MFSEIYAGGWQQVLDLSRHGRDAVTSICPETGAASEFARLLWARDFGRGGELDRDILARSVRVKSELYRNCVFPLVPIYVSSVCVEQCLYCNFRAGNKGVQVERRRLSLEELEREAVYLIEEKGLKVLELVYATDPVMRGAAMCRHVELLRNLLEQRGGGMVGMSAEPLDEQEYRSLVDAGLTFSVLWQETYDRERYAELHPGKTKKADFDYRVNAFDRMLSAGLKHVGIGVLSGLADWRADWAMLMLHEEYLRQRYGRGADILGTPRLKHAPGAVLHETPFIPTSDEFRAVLALHNVFSPTTAAFVSTREEWNTCIELARGGGCLFTLNCATTPGGYSLKHGGRQFAARSYDAPVYAPKLEALGLHPVFDWTFDLLEQPSAVNRQPSAVTS